MAHSSPAPVLFDSHTHLNEAVFAPDRAAVLERARRQGVREMLVVGYDLASSASAAALAQEEGLYAAVGIQPHYARQTGRPEITHLRELLRLPRVVALGEIGLDYYRNRSPQEDQRRLLSTLLELAGEMGLPVVLHCREAYSDLWRILRQAPSGLRGVLHCFSGTPVQAGDFLALGFHISMAGPVTYPKAPKTWEVARQVPLGRLLVETDCPWLAPQRYRGQRNEPAYVVEVAARIAELRGLPFEVVAEATTRNARELFLPQGAPLG